MTPAPTYEQVWAFASLLRAFRRARRAKRGKGGEPAFYRDLEANLLTLSRELRERTYVPDPYRTFVIRHAKERIVSEATFRDRVVHHALVSAIEPRFEEIFNPHSYACRRGKGSHAALERAQALARRHRYFAKLDVRRYFETVEHSILSELLSSRLDDGGIVWLCRRLLGAAEAQSGAPRGLPIGNLPSQFWANVYLDPLDRHVTAERGQRTWLRYMDDMLAFGPSKAELWELVATVRRFCRERLGLTIKDEATRVAPVTDGVPWLGFRVFPGLVRLDGPGRRRLSAKLRRSMSDASAGPCADAAEAARAASLVGHASHAATKALRRAIVARGLGSSGPPEA